MRADTVPGRGVFRCASLGRVGAAAGWAGGQRFAIAAVVDGLAVCVR